MTKDERRAKVPQDIREAFSVLRMLRDDLPDGTYEDIRDLIAWTNEFIRGECDEPCWDDIRVDIADTCETYGLPSPVNVPA